MAGWQARLREAVTALDSLVSEERRLLEERTLAIVRAPVTGTVQGLVGLAEGTYVLPGQLLGYVSPDDRLVAGGVCFAAGTSVSSGPASGSGCRSTPIPTRNGVCWKAKWKAWPPIAAPISNSTVAVYKIVIRPAAVTLRLRGGVRGELRKGMTLSARLVVTRRSLLQLLHEDVSGWLDPEGKGAAAS